MVTTLKNFDTPECDKWARERPRYQEIKSFLESAIQNGWELELVDFSPKSAQNIDACIFRYLEIDPVKLESERRALLDLQREVNAHAAGTDHQRQPQGDA